MNIKIITVLMCSFLLTACEGDKVVDKSAIDYANTQCKSIGGVPVEISSHFIGRYTANDPSYESVSVTCESGFSSRNDQVIAVDQSY